MIDQLTIERITDAAQVVDVVSEFVTLRRRGVNYIGLCPFHNEKTPSFTVSPAKGLWKCFGCGKGGNAIHFVMEHEQLSYYEALKWLAHKYGIEVKERELSDEERKAQNLRESMFVVNQFARDYFCDTLYNNKEGQTVGMQYFYHRGFRDDTIKKFQLGYCPGRGDQFATAAQKAGYSRELLAQTGLCIQYEDGRLRDRFWGRVMFPVHTLSGKVVAFGGRVMQKDPKAAKYVNSPESEIYHKSNQLYGIYFAKQAITRQDFCFLVEGYTDVISMHQAGIENVVASSGTSLTQGQIRLIHRFTNNIVVLYDGDYAGIKASLRGIDMLLEEGMNIKVVLLPDGEDPDSFARSHNASDFQQFIKEHEVDFIRFKADLLLKDVGNDPIKRAELVGDIVRSISVIPSDILRAEYVKECSQMLRVGESLLVSEINKMRKAPRKEQPTATPAGTGVATPAGATEGGDTPATAQPAGNTAEAAAPPTPTAADTVQRHLAQGEEALLLSKERFVVKNIILYGERPICIVEGDAEHPLRALEFVAGDLQEEQRTFAEPLHQLILEEGMRHLFEEGFEAKRFFLTHPNAEISRLAANLINERYRLSKRYKKEGVGEEGEMERMASEEEEGIDGRLYELFTHIMVDYKLSIVNLELKKTLKELQMPQNAANAEEYREIMTRYSELKKLQQAMAKHLGDRVITSM